jgi:spermidine/putrescine-binding protein
MIADDRVTCVAVRLTDQITLLERLRGNPQVRSTALMSTRAKPRAWSRPALLEEPGAPATGARVTTAMAETTAARATRQRIGGPCLEWSQDRDPENRYSIPYLWGITGIAWDSRRVADVLSWSALLDPRWRGKILMLDDARETIAFGALILGEDPNTRDPKTLVRIRQILIDQKPLVRAYDSASFDDAVLSGEVALAQSWSGQIAKIMKEAPWVRFTIPKEGAMVFVDNLAIPRNAPHPDLAHEFLDFVMEPEVAAEICLTTGYSTPSLAGRDLLPAAVRGNPAMFPGDAQMKQLRAFEDLGTAAALHDRLWTEVKSAR